MSKYVYSKDWTKDDIVNFAKELEGMYLKDIDKSGWLNNHANKGKIGNMIQVDYFGIPANSSKEADFHYHGIELKVTPIIKNSNGYVSKERLVLGMINYMKDLNVPFEKSLPNKKTKDMLLIFYLHEANTNPSEFKILKSTMFSIKSEDLEQIKKDYENIIDMINQGLAHQLSERQQKFLGACRKGQGNEKDFVTQPKSSILAKSRAYSYKSGYMTAYFQELMTPSKVEHICLSKNLSVIQTIHKTLDKYVGLTSKQIRQQVEYTGSETDKSYLYRLTSRMFDNHQIGSINRTQEFLKEGYSIKTIRNNLEQSKNQDMSFPNIDFAEIQRDSFEESSWYSMFAETKYILVIWDEFEKENYRFSKYLEWVPNDSFIIQAEHIYNHIKTMLVNNQVEVKVANNIWQDNLPKKNLYPPFQIRPKGNPKTSNTIVTLPNGLQIKKKCFFVNKEYIRKIAELDK